MVCSLIIVFRNALGSIGERRNDGVEEEEWEARKQAGPDMDIIPLIVGNTEIEARNLNRP